VLVMVVLVVVVVVMVVVVVIMGGKEHVKNKKSGRQNKGSFNKLQKKNCIQSYASSKLFSCGDHAVRKSPSIIVS
jgi:hypothetical protein